MAHPRMYDDADPALARLALIIKPDPDERPALVGDPRFFAPPYFGPGGWLALDLATPDVDWAEVRELLDSSYRQVALVRMVRALDAASGSDDSDDAASTSPGVAASRASHTPTTPDRPPALEPS